MGASRVVRAANMNVVLSPVKAWGVEQLGAGVDLLGEVEAVRRSREAVAGGVSAEDEVAQVILVREHGDAADR